MGKVSSVRYARYTQKLTPFWGFKFKSIDDDCTCTSERDSSIFHRKMKAVMILKTPTK